MDNILPLKKENTVQNTHTHKEKNHSITNTLQSVAVLQTTNHSESQFLSIYVTHKMSF